MKVRYAESKQVKQMREKFEKDEKIALRSSKTYKVSSKTNTYSARKVNINFEFLVTHLLHLYIILLEYSQAEKRKIVGNHRSG